ncbi:uncharacterized protein SCHCODRAFT_02329140 [Schizophyllum commune H4-8]|uniref:uncharacterized protein n=1 Tax=Schizophyllum commune (strain H4-8 / FGSC 9210) TaxID=578458 RepID=UPI002160D9D8|nr:uncharacterized protein SCHCODRAFT_02329140 [Schizophyllum commune H4-8]KAI5891793.1 hypothetical protein SCHCODRAFT_02329140 [Schizophyllum commune H4-8]
MAHIPIQMAPLVPIEHEYLIVCGLLDFFERTKLGFRLERYNGSRLSRDNYLMSELDEVISWAQDTLRKYPAPTVEFQVIIKEGHPMELAAIDHLVETLCFIPGWTQLVMSFELFPITISSRKRGTFEGLFARRGIGQLMFALDGKSVTYNGPWDLVPAPWMALERLSRFFVGKVDVWSNVNPDEAEDRLKVNAKVDWRVAHEEDEEAKINTEFWEPGTQRHWFLRPWRSSEARSSAGQFVGSESH